MSSKRKTEPSVSGFGAVVHEVAVVRPAVNGSLTAFSSGGDRVARLLAADKNVAAKRLGTDASLWSSSSLAGIDCNVGTCDY